MVGRSPDGLQTRGPALLMLVAGVIGALGSVSGTLMLHESPNNLFAAVLGALAAFMSWRIHQLHRDHAPQRTRSLLIAGFAVSFGSVLLLTGGAVGLLWSLLLAALGLNLLLGPLDSA